MESSIKVTQKKLNSPIDLFTITLKSRQNHCERFFNRTKCVKHEKQQIERTKKEKVKIKIKFTETLMRNTRTLIDTTAEFT